MKVLSYLSVLLSFKQNPSVGTGLFLPLKFGYFFKKIQNSTAGELNPGLSLRRWVWKPLHYRGLHKPSDLKHLSNTSWRLHVNDIEWNYCKMTQKSFALGGIWTCNMIGTAERSNQLSHPGSSLTIRFFYHIIFKIFKPKLTQVTQVRL